jgi:AcrR family transcriptional regulator
MKINGYRRSLDKSLPIGIVIRAMKNARNSILKAATELFAGKGYAGTSIREICKAAGITKPVLYYHFQSKEHMYQELMLDIFSRTKKNLQTLSEFPGNLRDRLVWYIHSEFTNSKEDPNSVRLLFRMMFSPEGEYPSFNFLKECQRERISISKMIREHNANCTSQKSELISTALMGMMLIEILEYFFTSRSSLTRGRAEKLVDLILPSAVTAKKQVPKCIAAGGRA